MSLPTVALSLGGCFLYVCSMSALGRLLAVCRERSSVVYIAPVTQQRIGA
jgi:hypothetical protein